jgi:tetratricopeptide (TPR) repeat protein
MVVRNIYEKISTPKDYLAGLFYYRASSWDIALHFFQRSIEKKPAHADSHFKLGMCHHHKRNYEQAELSIAHAMSLSPEKIGWQKQLDQSLKAQGKSVQKPLVASGDRLIVLLQLLLLRGDYVQFQSVLKELENCLGDTPLGLDTQLIALKCEAAIMMGTFDELDVLLPILGDSCKIDYYRAIKSCWEGESSKALSFLRSVLSANPQKVEIYFAAIEIAILTGETEIGFSVADELLTKKRSARSWYHLSRLVSSASTLQRYLTLLNKWAKSAKNSQHHLDIASVTALACLRGGDGFMARRVLHDSIFYHLNRKGYLASVRPRVLTFSQQEHLPTWLDGFDQLPYDTAIKPMQRSFQSLVDSSCHLAECDLETFLIHDTLVWALDGFLPEKAPLTLDLGVMECPSLEGLEDKIHKNSKFWLHPMEPGSSAILIKHSNGMLIRLFVHNVESSETYHDHAGVRWQSKLFSLRELSHGTEAFLVPADTTSYLSAFYSGERCPDSFDWVMQSVNRTVIDEDRLVCYAYEVMLQAKINKLDQLDAVARRCLIDLGEDKADYQEVLVGQYVIPDLAMIQKDGPQIVLYVSGMENVAYQANMWIPVLEKLDLRAAIVIRERKIASGLISTTLPVYLLRMSRDLELLEMGGVKTILYPGNPMKNVQALRFHRLNHCFINHGESDKVVNQSKFLMAYDKLLVAGPLAEKRLRNAQLPLRDDQVVYVGRPQVELSLQRVVQQTTSIKTVLYAPTWEGFVEDANYSSVSSFGFSMLQELAKWKGLHVLVKLHPYTGYNKSGETARYLGKVKSFVAEQTNMSMVPLGDTIHPYMNRSDALIVDISSVLNDYLYTLKPIILTNPCGESQDSLLENYPSSEAAYLLDQGRDVGDLIERVIIDDSLFETRQKVCCESLGDFPEGPMARFNKIVCELSSEFSR